MEREHSSADADASSDRRQQAEDELRRQADELRERNAELSRLDRVAIGRERSVAELKREVNDLCAKLGEPPRHRLADTAEQPVGGAGQAAPIPTPGEAGGEQGRLSPVRILVVDDAPDLLSATVRLLGNAGYTVDQASSGEDGLRAVRECRPDLLLLDRDLPGIDGLEVCRRIKQDPALADIFVLIVSGSYTASDEQAEGLESGADGYLTRPIENRQLLARMGAFVRIWRLTRSLREQTRELQERNEILRQQRLASLTLMEDAVESRNRLEEAHQALHEGSQRHQALVEHAPLAIYVDRADRLVLVNAACLRLFGATAPEHLLGKPPLELFHPDCRATVSESIRQLREQGVAVPLIEERIVRLDGRPVDVEFTAAPFLDQGVTAIHVVLRDITGRKRATARISQQMAELQRWYDAMIGRENRVRELKREVNEFCRRTGEPIRYPSQGAETGGPAGAEPPP